MVSIIQQHGYFTLRISAQHTFHVEYIPVIHTDQEIVAVIIRLHQADRPLSVAAKTVLLQLGSGRRIDRVSPAAPDLFIAGRGGRDIKPVGKAGFLYHIFHNEFGHGRPTDIAVAYEKYLYHKSYPHVPGISKGACFFN